MLPKRRNGKKVKQPRQNALMVLRKPPPLIYDVRMKQLFRFTSVAGCTRTSISWTDLTDLICVATSAVTAVKLFQFVRLKYVEVWDDAVAGSNASVSVTFDETDTNQASERKTYTDTSIGIEVAHVKCFPARDSLTSNWHGVSGNNAFELTLSQGAIIDVMLELRNQGNSAIACQSAVVAATLGATYYRGLDGLAIATTNFLPPDGPVRI